MGYIKDIDLRRIFEHDGAGWKKIVHVMQLLSESIPALVKQQHWQQESEMTKQAQK